MVFMIGRCFCSTTFKLDSLNDARPCVTELRWFICFKWECSRALKRSFIQCPISRSVLNIPFQNRVPAFIKDGKLFVLSGWQKGITLPGKIEIPRNQLTLSRWFCVLPRFGNHERIPQAHRWAIRFVLFPQVPLPKYWHGSFKAGSDENPKHRCAV